MNPEPDYSAAYVVIRTSDPLVAGHSLLFTTGRGNDVACAAVRALERYVVGRDVAATVADIGAVARALTWDGQLRWLGPEKGVMHMAIGVVVNALWDLRCRIDGQPLWRVLSSMEPAALVAQVDFTYIDDALDAADALEILTRSEGGRVERTAALESEGLAAYTTSAGWLGYDDDKVHRLARRSGRRWLHHAQAEGRGDSGVRRPTTRARPRRRRRRRPDRRRRQPAVGRRPGDRADAPAGPARSLLDRGADVARRRARTSTHPPSDRADPCGDRRARPEPGHLQAAVAGGSDRRRADRRLSCRRRQREPGHPAARRPIRRAGLPTRRRRRPVRDGAAPGDVRLRRRVGKHRRALDRVRRPPARALRRAGHDQVRALRRPDSARCGRRAATRSIDEYRFPNGPAWTP